MRHLRSLWRCLRKGCSFPGPAVRSWSRRKGKLKSCSGKMASSRQKHSSLRTNADQLATDSGSAPLAIRKRLSVYLAFFGESPAAPTKGPSTTVIPPGGFYGNPDHRCSSKRSNYCEKNRWSFERPFSICACGTLRTRAPQRRSPIPRPCGYFRHGSLRNLGGRRLASRVPTPGNCLYPPRCRRGDVGIGIECRCERYVPRV